MINSFDVLPNEIILQTFTFVSRQDQARLSQVDKRLNQLAKDKSLDLFEYKSENKRIDIGNVYLRIIKNNPLDEPVFPYSLYTIKDRFKVYSSDMYVSKKFFDDLVKTIEKGPSSIIELLKNSGKTASLNAEVLEEALKRKK